jgi:ribonucleoside-triphosphate reductase
VGFLHPNQKFGGGVGDVPGPGPVHPLLPAEDLQLLKVRPRAVPGDLNHPGKVVLGQNFPVPVQKLSPGGAISYVEVPNMQNNIPAVLAIMKHIYKTIMYAELNTKSDYCQVCGYSGEIEIKEDEHHKLIWRCPNCGNTDQNKMNVARRTCGYIGTQYWNQGRTQEIKERVLHL